MYYYKIWTGTTKTKSCDSRVSVLQYEEMCIY